MFAAFRRSWWCDFYPCFYRDKCINLGLGLFSYVCFSVIRFCSVYVIRLFSRCSRFLDPALKSIFHYLYHDHCLSWVFKLPFTTLGCYCLVIYGWLFLISYFFIHVFLRQVSFAGHRSQVAGHRSQVTGHRSQVAGHRSQVTGHKLQVTAQ